MVKTRTISLEMYAPDGSKVRISETIEKPQELESLLEWTRDAGLSAAAPSFPEQYEQAWVTEVALMMKRNDDGTETPQIAFYQKQLDSRWLSVYLNNDSDKAEFEARTGLKIADLPECDGDSHPTRSSKSAARLIIALPYPLKIERRTRVWGEADTDKRHYLNRYLSGKPAEAKQTPPSPAIHWSKDAQETAMVDKWVKAAQDIKPDFYKAAIEAAGSRETYPSSYAYCESLKKIAAQKETESQSEDIPF